MGGGLSTGLGSRSLHDENQQELKDYLHRVRMHDQTCADLDLSNRFIGVEGARQAADTVARNKIVKDLNLSYNHLGGSGRKGRRKVSEQVTGMALLEPAFSINTHLTTLNLAGNNLGNEGAACVARVLAENKHLTKLSLFNNYINDAAVDGLAEGLSQNTSLTSLNLKYNDISDIGANALIKLLTVNTALTDLDLTHNDGVTDQVLKELEKGLSRNREIQAQIKHDKEEAERKEKEKLEEEERARAEREAQLKTAREQIEKEYQEMEEEKKQERERQEWIEYQEQLKRDEMASRREARSREKQEHTENLVNLAYAWRNTIHGGLRRGREWRSGFQTYSDNSYTLRDTLTPPSTGDMLQKRRLHACWCEPTEQSVLYGGQLHYHCTQEPQAADQLMEDGKPRKYMGCLATAHRCSSAPIAMKKKDRRGGDGLFSTTAPAASHNAAGEGYE
eukprot:TRINITY_DN85898_c0_g1_i1.p1 TRINITY_DN85898_c0_g1~~TRINITY_DN85898_c0_g1_i1.p1  ORF type:complete len:449 (+),score=66.09 TRINITY_DN85898_c0_g1_i1:64-1410(+)